MTESTHHQWQLESTHHQWQLKWSDAVTDVAVGSGMLNHLGPCCRPASSGMRALIVTDETVADLYAARALESLRTADFDADLAIIPAGEQSKSLERFAILTDHLARHRIRRDDLIVGLGGGVVTDLTGFAAAAWMRGVPCAYCPTTLEAAIDAAVGGKTGLNHAAGKNLIGVFRHPRSILIDTDCLNTLSGRDLAAGLAESVKHAFLTGEAAVSWHEAHAAEVNNRSSEALVELIRTNIDIKAAIVARDEREQEGPRAMLNFGHTLGHALENQLRYALRHGECVAVGMVAACRISEAMAGLDPAITDRLIRMLRSFNLPTHVELPVNRDALRATLSLDKKARRNRVRFVLIEDIGRPILVDNVPDDVFTSAAESILTGQSNDR